MLEFSIQIQQHSTTVPELQPQSWKTLESSGKFWKVLESSGKFQSIKHASNKTCRKNRSALPLLALRVICAYTALPLAQRPVESLADDVSRIGASHGETTIL